MAEHPAGAAPHTGDEPADGHRTMIELTLARLEEHGDRVAITVDDADTPAEWTYRDVLDRVRIEARRLDGCGVRRGDVVAIMAGTTPIGLVLRWAVNVVGAAFTSFADGYSAAAVAELLTTCRARFLVTDHDRRALAADAAARAGSTTVVDIDDAYTSADPTPLPVRLRPEDLASISLTGGSTGVPKGVPRRAAVPDYSSPAALAGWRDTVQLVCTPIAHIAGTIALVVLAAGGRVVLQRGFDAGRVLAVVPREKITTIQLMPRLLHQLLDHPDLDRTDTTSLRRLRIGSAPASAERIGEALDRFGPVLGQTYGSIEATTITTIGADELARPELRGTVGRPVPGVTVSIRDDGGAELPAGATGEIWVRGSAVMPGYVGDPQQSAAVLHEGWFRTGDLGHLDDAGYLTLAGRTKDVIFAEPARIYPGDVENALLAHPAVAAAGVFAVADPDGTESAAAAVVPRPGHSPSPDALLAWVAERRGPARAPAEIHLVDDLPTTPSGKIDRAALRRELTGR
ncbi:class I adenylate-forming enzyme family protein [Pseudonocardia sp. KRD291]|uniref:class I adenylate-forming enzyme family protein n=1 Tax=Pseudonocardia sp. KRD291 TaxID=2792007 RepID=UPI001C49DB02|nr:class I adenylate-forming enzyme family protein [Pseudonocardia sp. KRD291]MBW0104534.1 acyl--CoA ligase [Pseudonocardia sp. KRD291]